MTDAKQFTKYEQARILGARALQIAMNAPLLIKISDEDLEKIKFDALKIAEVELNSNILPISVRKPFPEKREDKLKRAKEQKISDKKIENMITGTSMCRNIGISFFCQKNVTGYRIQYGRPYVNARRKILHLKIYFLYFT